MSVEHTTYLGDSVYARWEPEASGVTLFLNNGYGEKNPIFLEPEVLDALNRFCERMRQRQTSTQQPRREPSHEA